MNKLILPDCVLWDMDGTLIDQSKSIIKCYENVFLSLKITPLPSPIQIKKTLGGPMESTLRSFVSDDSIELAAKKFREQFQDYLLKDLLVLDGAHELMSKLNEIGVPQAILTNKLGSNARAIQVHCEFNKYISICLGNKDTTYQKPDPNFTYAALNLMGKSEDFKEILVIGDSPTDIITAKNIGAKCYAIATGAHDKNELNSNGADKVFDNLNQLLEFWSI